MLFFKPSLLNSHDLCVSSFCVIVTQHSASSALIVKKRSCDAADRLRKNDTEHSPVSCFLSCINQRMTMASRTLSLLPKRRALVASLANKRIFHPHRPSIRSLSAFSQKNAAAALVTNGHANHDESSSFLVPLSILTAASVLSHHLDDDSTCHNDAATASWEPLRQAKGRGTAEKPRNVMLHHMRSNRGRSLEDKYNVDWKTVLGEGAYGSVHPARLAATGEKVSLLM